MRRLLLVSVCAVAAVSAGALYAHAGAASSTAAFRTPDAGAACRVAGAALVCSSLGTTQSLSLRGDRSPTLVRRLPWWDASTPVLRHWRRGAVSCSLAGSAIVCRNGGAAFAVDGGGFAAAR